MLTCALCQLLQPERTEYMRGHEVGGLCLGCVGSLARELGRPTVRLRVFRVDGPTMQGEYDGAGALMRLSNAQKLAGYAGFALERLGARA